MSMPLSAPGRFIAPDPELETMANPNERTGIPIRSGYQAMRHVGPFLGQNRIFDDVVARISQLDVPYEDQCSAKYYLDLVSSLLAMNGEFDRVVEVGCYMGGSASVIAGCADRLGFGFDIVDIREAYLRFAYERIRRIFPAAAERVRLFHGSLPQYVDAVLGADDERLVVHHDGAHNFMQVTKDLASLYYLGNRMHALIIQDTHLRGTMEQCYFVDMAVYAVFGTEVAYVPIGSAYDQSQTEMMNPNRFQGEYFMPGVAEGIVVPMASNSFKYPHPTMPLQSFI